VTLTVRAALDIICELAATSCKADISCIVRCTGKSGGEILGLRGSNVTILRGQVSLEALHKEYRPVVTFDSLDVQPWFQGHALRAIAPSARKMIAVAIPLDATESVYLSVLCKAGRRDEWDVPNLSHLAMLASAMLNGPIESRTLIENRIGLAEKHPELGRPQGEEAILSFIAKTMLKRPALKARSGTSFAVVRRWKPQLKETQIAAVQALKISPNSIAAALAARDIVETLQNLFHSMKFSAVVPVPGGSSGMARSLSVQIGEQVAANLGLPFNDCLVGSDTHGSSHPHKSLKLKPYALKDECNGTVLLVDDIVTTGTHLLKASQALSNSGVASFAIAWIGG
jgi:hypoxanthine-guanine phosphoribosyltransferase